MPERLCPCGSGLPRSQLLDARGISCGFVCNMCVKAKRAKYRPELFTNPNYYADEPIDPD